MILMPKKPTLLQSILGQPSQSYSFPNHPSHNYRNDFLRNASADHLASPADAPYHSGAYYSGARSSLDSSREQRPAPPPTSSGKDQAFVPNHAIQQDVIPLSSHTDDNNLDFIDDVLEDSESENSDSEDSDVFYTPNTSPHTSMHIDASVVIAAPPLPQIIPFPSPKQKLRSMRKSVLPQRPQSSASTTSLTSVSDSIFSSPSIPRSSSTRISSPLASDTTLVSSSSRRSTYTDEDWAKDVRWLVAPQSKPKRRTTLQNVSPSPSPPPVQPLPARRAKSTRNRKKGSAPGNSLMMSMAALLEEDEDRDEHSLHRQHSARLRAASSPAAPPRTVITSPSISNPHPLSRTSSVSAKSRKTHVSHSPSSTTTRSPYTTAPSTVLIPSPLPSSSAAADLPSSGTAGYTSLTLPRAAYSPSNKPRRTGADGKIDLTRAGVAQTTMATVEVVRGISGSVRGLGIFGIGRKRRMSVSGGSGSTSSVPASFRFGFGGGGVDGERRGADALGFTSHRKPPGYVPSGGVLVQVWAVGVDSVDDRLVCEKSGGGGGLYAARSHSRSGSVGDEGKEKGSGGGKVEVGYIPGRSFVGRVLECGWEVREEVCRKGEWAVGLLDVRKCGALAEFIVVDRHRIHRVAYPRMSSLGSPLSLGDDPGDEDDTSLTLEELALLPLTGIPAYRAFRTFSAEVRDTRPKRVLVLCANAGVGAMSVQLFARRGWEVCAHVDIEGIGGGEKTAAEDEEEAVEARVLGWGAMEVVFDDGEGAAGVLARLKAQSEVFDAILDTVGGREVWEAGERLLAGAGRGGGQFTTLVGDVRGRAVPSAGDHFRAGLRSMGVGGSGGKGGKGEKGEKKEEKKGKGAVGYAWVSVASDVDMEGRDVRDTLGAVLRLAVEEGVRPADAGAVPFERTPEVFGRIGEGCAVVRVVG